MIQINSVIIYCVILEDLLLTLRVNVSLRTLVFIGSKIVTSQEYTVSLMAVVALLISRTSCCSPGSDVYITCLLLEIFSH